MRNMSFMLTTEQFRNRSKTVTRRIGWWDLQPGERLMGVEKGQGLKKGETIVRLGPILIVDARGEPLNRIDQDECNLEGFPELTPEKFVKMFCVANRGCTPETEVNRIQFKYLDAAGTVHMSKTTLDPAAGWPFPKGKKA